MPSDIVTRVNDLLAQRNVHLQVITLLDMTIAQIDGLVGTHRAGRRRGRPPKVTIAVTPVRRRRGRRSYPLSADDFVLAFVRSNRDATTAEVNAHWKSERPGGADVTLGKLVKAKRLKRRKVVGERGSRYAVA